MLTLTADAATLVRTLTRDARLPDRAGLRIVVDRANRSLSMALAEAPASRDAVVDSHGARVFLSPSAADRLHGRTLRADIGDGPSRFFLDR